MIYLDDLLPSHRKILHAGRLIGDAAGGRCAAIGLFVSAIGYARLHLTDGLVPDEYLYELAKSRDPIDALRRAGLIRKVRGTGAPKWAIHDYHQWNKTSKEVLKERRLNRTRQEKWRAKKSGETINTNAGVTPLSECDSAVSNAHVTAAHDPQSPIPDPRTTKREQRPAGRGLLRPVEISAEQKSKLSKAAARDANFAVLERLAHDVIAAGSFGNTTDLVEAVKAAAAQHHIDYGRDSLQAAVRSAVKQRQLQASGGARPQRAMTAKERADADAVRRSWGACQHEPRCASYAACLTAIVRGWRDREAAAS